MQQTSGTRTSDSRQPMNPAAWLIVARVVGGATAVGIACLVGAVAFGGALSLPALVAWCTGAMGMGLAALITFGASRLAEDRRALDAVAVATVCAAARRMEKLIAARMADPCDDPLERAWWRGYNVAARDFGAANAVIPMPPMRRPKPAPSEQN